jgi:hypothetical protein
VFGSRWEADDCLMPASCSEGDLHVSYCLMQASVKAVSFAWLCGGDFDCSMDRGMNGWKQADGQQLTAYGTSPLAVCRYDWRPSSA